MAQPSHATVSELKPAAEDRTGFPAQDERGGMLEVNDFSPGIYTSPPRANRPVGSAAEIINARIRDDWVGRRGGYPAYITKPDSNDIIRLIAFHGDQNDNRVVRVSNGGLHVAAETDNWVSYTGTPYSLFNRTDYAQLLGRLYLANPSKKIVEVNFQDESYAEIADENAPIARYVTAFAERIVAAYIHTPMSGGALTFGLKWSVNSDPTDWTGEGSGEENLIQSPSDTGDEITGVFAVSNIMIIMRERSIWHATRQPFALAPFRFTPVITNLGCDMPWTIARVSDEQGRTTGLVFADNRTKGIYSYTPGARPVRLNGSLAVEDQLFTGLVNPEMSMAAYDPLNAEYHLGLPTDTDIDNKPHLGKFWVASMKNGSIVSDDGPVVTSIDVVTDVGDPVMIDELTGFIDDLDGVIDDLGGVFIFAPIVVKGDTVDPGQSIVEDLNTAGTHVFNWTSQDLGSVSRGRVIKQLQMAMSAVAAGDTSLEWSRDLITWTTLKTVADVSALIKFGFKKQLKGDRIYWRVTSEAQEFRMTEWWARVQELVFKRLVP